MSKPIQFPADGKREEVLDLPAYLGGGQTISISYWKLTWVERISILLGGCVWLWVMGNAHAAVYVGQKPRWSYAGGCEVGEETVSVE